MQSSRPPQPPTPPFDFPAARRLREALGMAHGHVAYGLRAGYGLTYVTADTVASWERGLLAPSAAELTALAATLWCSPGDLMSAARTLREHRVARGLAPDDVARQAGVELQAYLRMEETNTWRGNERQSQALARALRLAAPDFVEVTGRAAPLAELLRSAVTTRWQGYVRPVTKLLPVEKRQVEKALRQMHEDYQARMARTLNWGSGPGPDASGEAGRDYLERVLEHFWGLVPTDGTGSRKDGAQSW
ncbi:MULTISPECIES: transcriptional regulator [unclassified Streptomyces]|uniref:transcriptional regulator n=1 Tax=unclassified Streptomyces TaxID=2593676 RepID=UPI00099F3413|nr:MULTISPECIES: transcriptional regulator [unclassified Streptomyces]THC52286.1 XRE family transcriptional regulator [Streptomyces sp. A1499]